ncbi:hypothetical protein CHLRE_10g459950v5 [Chlamydomonas reinhardtii]|uniref:Uncharacterized protein n=1 Tax=Chlamydomonas reinhardtii TaxID=3055 RepID=A0A2K3DBT6_CHLRE|nr:uncharacterized protein CHLRE_10g459950v5 [Chlamydomonas reinhardtii]PNW77991.1 hypothetical protein CHLRE_10g459950v5 [Chlamydomonas reinhardtii]
MNAPVLPGSLSLHPHMIPIKVSESYVRPGLEARLFPDHPHFLSLDDVYAVFPSGVINQKSFSHSGYTWKLVNRLMANGNNIYLAVLDESQLSNGYTNGVGERTTNTTTATTNIGSGHYTPVATPDAVQRLRSQPLDSYMVNTSQESDGFGGAAGGITDITPPYLQGGPQHSQHGLPPMPGHPQAASSSAGMHGAASAPGPLATLPSGTYRNGNASMGSLGSIRERTGSLNSMQHALVATQGGGGGGGGGGLGHHGLGHCLSMGAGGMAQAAFSGGVNFTREAMTATDSPVPVERYKAISRMIRGLERVVAASGLPCSSMHNAVVVANEPAWLQQDGQNLLRQILVIAECLNKFPTAEYADGGKGNNATRAITAKDFDELVRQFILAHGGVFTDEFLGRLPHELLELRDDLEANRGLLMTRYSTNDKVFGALIQAVGHEPSGGGAMVFNATSVSANPVNHMLAAPKTLVNTVSNAWSKADTKRRTQMGALGAVAVVALWVLKRKLFGGGGGGGGGGRGRRGGGWEDSEDGYSGRRRRGGGGGGGELVDRLVDRRAAAEHTSVRYVAACQDELRRAAKNDALLRADWRLGPVRLALPGSGPVPEGYESVQPEYCNVDALIQDLNDRRALKRPLRRPGGSAGAVGPAGLERIGE